MATIKFIRETKEVTVYSLVLTNEVLTEFEKFAEKYKDSEYAEDFGRIVRMLERISENGAQERYFRPEGKMSDNVCALPVSSCRLRLYCIRISDGVLIVGNGGVKNTQTYEEDCFLLSCVATLQKLEALIKKGVKEGLIVIEEHSIDGIEDKYIDL